MAGKMGKANGRATNGQFLPGHPGGPGRPARATEETYLLSLAEAVTPKVWASIVQRAIADATEGNHQARTWLAEYLIGGMNLTGAVERESAADGTREKIFAILTKLGAAARQSKDAEDAPASLPMLPVAR